MTVNTDMTTDMNTADLWSDPETGVNEAAIREVLGFIELHQERWNQTWFIDIGECGTVGCFMGWAALLHAREEFDLDVIDKDPIGYLRGAENLIMNKLEVRRFLGLTVGQFSAIYHFLEVADPDPATAYRLRRPTFDELCERVAEVTGVVFRKPETEDE